MTRKTIGSIMVIITALAVLLAPACLIAAAQEAISRQNPSSWSSVILLGQWWDLTTRALAKAAEKYLGQPITARMWRGGQAFEH